MSDRENERAGGGSFAGADGDRSFLALMFVGEVMERVVGYGRPPGPAGLTPVKEKKAK